tara:strand:+ start:95 stop:358 length:264 start_codon:yes stop_codon:yes gene_type:complete
MGYDKTRFIMSKDGLMGRVKVPTSPTEVSGYQPPMKLELYSIFLSYVTHVIGVVHRRIDTHFTPPTLRTITATLVIVVKFPAPELPT